MLERATPLGIGRTGQPGRRGTIRQRSAIGKDDPGPAAVEASPEDAGPHHPSQILTNSPGTSSLVHKHIRRASPILAKSNEVSHEGEIYVLTYSRESEGSNFASLLRTPAAVRRPSHCSRIDLIERVARFRALRQPEKTDDILLCDSEVTGTTSAGA